MDKVAALMTRHARGLAILTLLSTAAPMYWLTSARIDNSIEVWLGRNSPDYSRYRDFLNRFGNEEFVVIACESDDPLGESSLAMQRAMTTKLRQIGNVDMTLAPCDLADGLSQVQTDWKRYLETSEFPRNLLLSQDRRTFGIIVWLKILDTPALRRQTVEQIEFVVHEVAPDADNIHLAGTPLMNVELDRGSQRASQTFMPIALLASVAILAIVIRNPLGVMAVICSSGIATLWTMGLLIASGKTLNMVTVALPSLLFVLSLSGGIHIVSRFLRIGSGMPDRFAAMRATLKEVMVPIFISSITTSAGFGSLIISDMQPVIDFGIFASLGIMVSFLANLVVAPGLLLFWPVRTSAASDAATHWTSRIAVVMAKNCWKTLGASSFLLIVCIGWTTQARVESNVLKFFPDHARISRDYQFIRDNLTGFYTVEIELVTDPSGGKQLLKNMEQLSQQLLLEADVAKVLDYGSINAFTSGIRWPAMTDAAQVRANPLRQMLGRFRVRSDDRIHLRMSVFVRAMSSRQFYSLIDTIDWQCRSTVAAPASYTLTGVVPLLNAAQQSLIDTQIKTFSIALAVVLVLIGIFMKSFGAMVAAILPNVLPIFVLFSIMVLADIPIDAATVMTASIAIGIAVDDTVHFLSHFRARRRDGQKSIPAIRDIYSNIGPAITLTSVVATVGFAILCLSQFKPIRYFGLLAGVTMVTAWITDITVTPACATLMQLWKPHNKGQSRHA